VSVSRRSSIGPTFFVLGGAGAVIACNHIGWADTLWMAYAVYPRQLLYMYVPVTPDQSREIHASFLGNYLSFDPCAARWRPSRRAATASPTADHANRGRRDEIANSDGPTAPFQSVECHHSAGREEQRLNTANGILYQMSGSTEVTISGEAKTLSPSEGLFLAEGKPASLKAGTVEVSRLLHFLLIPAADQDQPVETKPAIVKDLFRTVAPISDLKPGSYDLNLTRVTFPAQMPSNPPHHRSGAALYYIISGTGANTVDGKTDVKEPGSLIYEPFDLVHQWGNPSDTPFTFLAFNINPEGVAAVIPGAPTR